MVYAGNMADGFLFGVGFFLGVLVAWWRLRRMRSRNASSARLTWRRPGG